MRDEFDVKRFRSTRAYRRAVDWALHAAIRGEMAPEDAARIATASKIGCELFMAEKALARAGIDKEPDADALLGDDGGAKLPGSVKTYRRKKVVVKSGRDKFGGLVDDKTVSIETSAHDEGAEDQAEIEAAS